MIDLRKERERRRRKSNKETILHAAEALIVRKGLSAVTMDDIAREAQFSKATLYQYIKGKGDLVREIVLHYYDDILQMFDEILDSKSGAGEKLKAIIRSSLDVSGAKANISRFIAMDDSMLRIMKIIESGQMEPSSEELKFIKALHHRLDQIWDRVRALFVAGVDSGEFRPMDSADATRILTALIQGMIHQRFWPNHESAIYNETELVFDFIFQGIQNRAVPLKGEFT
jgi:AcrR family transcriptional regulator